MRQLEASLFSDLSSSKSFIRSFAGQVIKFKASANGHDINMKIKSDQRVDNGQWHIVKLEQDNYNIRLTFGSKTKLIDIQHQNLPKFLAFPGYMYIGGVPSK